MRHSLVPVGEVPRPHDPDELSAITWAGGARYYAANDENGEVVELEIKADPKTGALKGCTVGRRLHLADSSDIEGLALDPLTKTLWAADEGCGTIRCHRLTDGSSMAEVALPGCFSSRRINLGLESLTIREDGLEMWTANEEALKGDGPVSSRASGSLVRLARFVRPDAVSPWQAAGQWAYRTDPMRGLSFRGISSSGVADLCALPDGTLLVLEREMSHRLWPSFRCRIYQVRFAGADDVASVPALKGMKFRLVAKELLFDAVTGWANYEGMCLGPGLEDGSRLVLLVSDGGGLATEHLYALRLLPEP